MLNFSYEVGGPRSEIPATQFQRLANG
jgi:hypothetical protein